MAFDRARYLGEEEVDLPRELPGDLRLDGASIDGVEVRAEDATVESRTPTDTLLSVRLRVRPQYSWIGAGPIYGVEVLADGETPRRERALRA